MFISGQIILRCQENFAMCMKPKFITGILLFLSLSRSKQSCPKHDGRLP